MEKLQSNISNKKKIYKKKKKKNFFTRLTSSLVSPSATYYTQLFATGDSKGAIRLWDINQFQKSLIFRPSRAIRGACKT
jgi:WD40 repeat protein